MRLDHIVLWVEDPVRSLDFYQRVVGLSGLREAEFRSGSAPFPSVRVSGESIIDLMSRADAPSVDSATGAENAAGHPVNHFCLAMSQKGFESLRDRLAKDGVAVSATTGRLFGAQGLTSDAFYFQDPDCNVVEARYYS